MLGGGSQPGEGNHRLGRGVGPVSAFSSASGTLGQHWDPPSTAAGNPLPAAKQPPKAPTAQG